MFDLHEDKLVLLDLNVQRDIFHPTGTLYTPASGVAYRNILRLFGWAERRGLPVLSTVLLNRLGRRGPLSPIPHCIDGAAGAEKMPGTCLRDAVNLGDSHTADLPQHLLEDHRQVIFETRDCDPFRHLKFDRLVSELPDPQAHHFILCGAALSKGIKHAVLGLRAHGMKATIAVDAVASLALAQTEMDWLKVSAKGAAVRSVAEITAALAHCRRRPRQAAS